MSRRDVLFDYGTLCIVDCRTELGFTGAERSTRLFAVDAWRLSEGFGSEFGRGSREWQQRNPLTGCEIVYAASPTLLAEFDADAGWLGIEDAAAATSDAARYVGIEYDEARWRACDADEYRVALLASASCTSCWPAASMAMENITHAQLEAITPEDVAVLMNHPHGALRLAAIQALPCASSFLPKAEPLVGYTRLATSQDSERVRIGKCSNR